MLTERDKKKAAKAAKRAEKEAAERAKDAELQKKLIEVFNEKQSKAAKETDPVAKLKHWLHKPPYKSSNKDMKVSYELLTLVERNFLLSVLMSATAQERAMGIFVQSG